MAIVVILLTLIVGALFQLTLYLLTRPPPEISEADKRVLAYVESQAEGPDGLPLLPDCEEDELERYYDCTGEVCQRQAIAIVKAKYGVLPDTAANRLVVGRAIRDAMVSMKMRPSHIADRSLLALEFYFIPTDIEILASEVRYSATAAARKKCVRQFPRG